MHEKKTLPKLIRDAIGCTVSEGHVNCGFRTQWSMRGALGQVEKTLTARRAGAPQPPPACRSC